MDWIKTAAIIGVGAVFGANLRYFVSDWLARHQTASFPLGTLAVNTTGSIVLAFFLIWTTERVLSSPQWRFLRACDIEVEIRPPGGLPSRSQSGR